MTNVFSRTAKFMATGVLGGALLAALPARADTFNWSYSSSVPADGFSNSGQVSSGISGSGQFTATLIGVDQYLISSITGTETDATGTHTINALDSYAGADQNFSLTSPQLDNFGFSFSVIGIGTSWNIEFGNTQYIALNSVDNPGGFTNGDPDPNLLAIAVDFQVDAVPGPVFGTGLPGLALACGGLIALMRRLRRRNGSGAASAFS